MLTAKKVNQIVDELQADPGKVETLIRWIGGRVKVEIERIVARSLQYSLALFDRFPKGMTGGEVQRRMWGFLVAAYDLRERVPPQLPVSRKEGQGTQGKTDPRPL